MYDESFAQAKHRSDELADRIAKDPGRFRMLTGDRPTGPLHLGHYFGTLANRVALQRAGVDTFLLVADYQVITDRETLGDLSRNVEELVADYLAAGIDPDRATIFTHSSVPAANQLLLPFLSLVSESELQRNPTVKSETAAAGLSTMNGLMLTYPVHQAADILFCQGSVVPVGKDQLPHLEMTRLVARRFNERYANGVEVFPQPEALLSDAPLLLGTDGQKMSKSRGNSVKLGDSEDQTAKLIRRAKTDAERHITYDPEHRPEVSSLVLTAALCQDRDPVEIAAEIGDGGSGQLKKLVTEAVNEKFRPLRARRAELLSDPGYIFDVLARGNARANEVADETLDRVRAAMGMDYSRLTSAARH